MAIDRHEFLKKRGAIELLCEIDPRGSRWKELEPELSGIISKQTLATRLEQGRDVSLLDREPTDSETGSTNLHVFSPEGATLRLILEKSGTVRAYHQFKRSHNEFYNKSEQIQHWARRELDTFRPAQHEENFELLKETNEIPYPDAPSSAENAETGNSSDG
ncbi:hypothetical protein [Natronorubrum sp. DTA7]|uniref:hypothetical protein n=1 Tax=Natronorubrum sp. DTA7 TaxID=3447016 RepID=UPI003F868144